MTTGQKVYRTPDRGLTWVNVTGNLPDVPLANVVAHPVDPDLWYLGTEFGFYRTVDGGKNWERWNTGLPEAVMVTEAMLVDLRDESGELFIAAGTYGRGFWMRSITPQPTAVDPVDVAETTLWSAAPSPNPSRVHTELRFRLAAPGPVELRLFDVRGRLVSTLVDETRSAGEHVEFVPTAKLAPGVYLVRLDADGRTESRRITVVR